MEAETAEIPAVVARLIADPAPVASVAAALRRRRPPLIVMCGRASSGHACQYLRVLVETRLGLPVCELAPSTVTLHGCFPAPARSVLLVISQSGASPDLVAVAEAARRAGSLAVGMVNAAGSPLEAACDLVVPLGAGQERSVAATKTVAAAVVVGLMLIARWARDDDLAAALEALPPRLDASLGLDWSSWARALPTSRAAYVTARGLGLGAAREIALKIAETLGVPAIGESAAELLHGPRAAIGPTCPVLALHQEDSAAASVDGLAERLVGTGTSLFRVGGLTGTLPWIGDGSPVTDPLCWLVPAYLAIAKTARSAGRDPDNPRFLSKVTKTL